MKNFSYSLSPFVNRSVTTLEALRKDIVLTPLSPQQQLQAHFAAAVTRITCGLKLAGEEIAETDVERVLTDHVTLLQVSRSPLEEKIITYKNVLDYLQQEWLLSDRPVTKNVLLMLYQKTISSPHPIPDRVFAEMAVYLQSSTDNAYVQAAIAQLYCAEKTEGNDMFATFVSYLLLYRAGYDFRGLFSLEKALYQNINEYKNSYQKVSGNENITKWIENYLETLSLYLIDVRTSLQHYPKDMSSPQIEINDRQKAILTLLDAPAAVITNKDVQHIFHISQITASRDLAKLAMLGLLIAHGKGRSVKYSKFSINY